MRETDTEQVPNLVRRMHVLIEALREGLVPWRSLRRIMARRHQPYKET